MKYEAIRQLVLRLPAESPYFPEKLRKSSLAERLAVALNDPAFLWNLASSYAAAGLPLPAYVCNPAALRANCYLRFPGHPDHGVAEALALNLPPMRTARDVVRAMLCCRDATLEEIGELHWNFRDRAQELLYVAQVLYKRTRCPDAAAKQQEEADPGLRLMRLGYERGLRAVLQAAGLSPLDKGQGTADLPGQIQSALLSQAAIAVDMGLTSARDNPASVQSRPLILLAMHKPGAGLDEDDIRGLGGDESFALPHGDFHGNNEAGS